MSRGAGVGLAESDVARSLARPFDRPHSEYEFLVGQLIDAATLARAIDLAARANVHPNDVLIANGWRRFTICPAISRL